MRVSRRSGALVLAICSLGRAEASHTAPDPLTVERATGAEACPSAIELGELVEQIRGRDATGTSTSYQVSFTREGTDFVAAIRVTGAESEARVLRDSGQTCETLARATAVTVSLLMDAEATSGGEAESPREAPKRPPEAPPVAALNIESPPPISPNVDVTLSLGGVGLFGVVSTATPGVETSLGLVVSRFRASIGALWLKPVRHDLAPGSVEEALWSGSARVCVAPLTDSGFRLDVCSGVLVGVMTAEASGYTRNDELSKTWLAVPLESSFGRLSSPVGWEIAVAGLFPLRRQEFAVDNVGVVYDSWPLGVLVSLRLVGVLEF
jgi:hypothetical protein